MCIHIHFGETSEIITSSAKPARRCSPPAWAPVQAEKVRLSALQPRLPCHQSRASAVHRQQVCCARTLAKSSPAQVPCYELSSPEKSPILGQGHEDTASLSQLMLLQHCRGLNYLMLNIKQRCFPLAGLLTVHFKAGKIGRWLLSELGGGGTHHTKQITHLEPDLQNNSGPTFK